MPANEQLLQRLLNVYGNDTQSIRQAISGIKANTFKKGGLKQKAANLWYKKNVQPAIDELGLDEVRYRLYKNIAPYGYDDAANRIKSALRNEVPEFEAGDTGEEVYNPDRDDIWATYLQIPEEKRRNVVDAMVGLSEYAPTITDGKSHKYHNLLLSPYDKQALVDKALSDTEDISQDAYDGYLINRNHIYPPLEQGELRQSDALYHYFGNHTVSRGFDPNKGDYVSYYDLWDLSPISGNGKDESYGIGKPIEFYDRIYLDDYFGVPYQQSHYLPEVEITAPGEYKRGGRIYIKPSHRGRFTSLLKRTGKPASWFKAHGTPAQRKMATFALNARKWKYADGGPIERALLSNKADVVRATILKLKSGVTS